MAQSDDTLPVEVPSRILIVDDDPETHRMLRSWLGDRPIRLDYARDGESGIRMANALRPDLIILDVTMPGIDGIEVADQLKQQPETRAIPVIMLTARREVDSKVRAFAAGADDYVTKPFELPEIDARIQSMLRRRSYLAGLESTVEELSDTNEQLEQLLMVDEKTGLFNFREFRRRLREEWSRARRYDTPLSVVFLDLDNFKRLNDTLGHPAGDRILTEFATLVAGGARANDVAARYGGEEFAVILPHTDARMAVLVADRIRRAVAEFVFNSEERPTHITVSAGVATYPAAGAIDSVDALVRAADVALYQAKDRGRNCVVQHDSSIDAENSTAAPRSRRARDLETPDSA